MSTVIFDLPHRTTNRHHRYVDGPDLQTMSLLKNESKVEGCLKGAIKTIKELNRWDRIENERPVDETDPSPWTLKDLHTMAVAHVAEINRT